MALWQPLAAWARWLCTRAFCYFCSRQPFLPLLETALSSLLGSLLPPWVKSWRDQSRRKTDTCPTSGDIMKQPTIPQSLPPVGSRQNASDSSPSLVLSCPFYLARVFPVNPVPSHAILDQCLSPATKEFQVDGRHLWPEARPLHPSPLPGTQQAPGSDTCLPLPGAAAARR